MDPNTYRTLLESLGADEATLRGDGQERIDLDTSLAGLKLEPEARLRIHLRECLGVGGMGSVHLAEQVALRRDVAAKVPIESGDERTRRAMLREAWITGALEHPNIVPIHDVLTLPSGEPCVLMKRIEGVSWLEIIDDPSASPREPHPDGPVVEAIEILLEVCDAVHFAHSRNVLHRDIKPANVMLGAYGEVYLVDWGIAVSYGDAEISATRAPIANDGISGTPVYMAPEMAKGDAAALGPWTDVYLLGATLHHALVGQPPHVGANSFETLLKATTSAPHPYGDLPSELRAILHRAMAAKPERRYRDVAELRRALAEVLRHRSSRALTDAAGDRLAEAQALAVGEAARPAKLAEARGTYQQALLLWSGNDPAREGLEHATLALVEEELARENIAAAAALLEELEGAAPLLKDQLAVLQSRVEERRHEVASLRQLGADRDMQQGAFGRSIAALVFAGVCFVNLMILWRVRPHPNEWSDLQFIGDAALSVGLTFTVLVAFGRTFRRNRANLSVAFTMVFATGAVFALRVLVARSGLPFGPVIALELFLYAIGFGGIAFAHEYRVLFGAASFLGGGIGGLLFPIWVVPISAVAVALGVGSLAWLWLPRR